MDSMMELVNALNALTAVLQKFTQQTTENYLNTFEELPTGDTDDAPVAESQPAPKPTVTIEQVRAVLSELSRAGKTVQVKELLKKHGGDKLIQLSAVDPAEYPTLLEEAGELNA